MGHGYGGSDWGVGIFWLFVAVAVACSAWEKVRRNAEKHETLRRIIEKTGTVDEAKLKELFSPAGSDLMKSVPGEIYRGLRMGGAIVLCVAAGAALFFLIMRETGVFPPNVPIIGMAASGIAAMVGVGLFIASRFAEPPAGPRS